MADLAPKSARIIRSLIIDDDAQMARTLASCLEGQGHTVTTVTATPAAVAESTQRSFDFIFIDLGRSGGDGCNSIRALRAIGPWVKIVVTAAAPTLDAAVEAMRQGASDYLPKPFTPHQVRQVARRIAEAQAPEWKALSMQEATAELGPGVDFFTASTEMREVVDIARRAAEGSAAILISGEPGVGKRTLARAIHAWSPRRQGPLTIAGCRAPSVAQLESDWFGAAKKTPGGELATHDGRIAFCSGGTLLIEDIEQLPLETQPKLLRLIQEGEYERRGDFLPRRGDVRVIATTATHLEQRVAEGSFRADLLHALQAVALNLPPLRRRPDDLLILSERLLALFVSQTRRRIAGFSPSAIDALKRHSWPGNLRELRNLVERAVLVCRGEMIETPDFPASLLNRVNSVALGDPVSLERIEELHIRGVLAASASIDAAAQTLGMDSVTLWRRRKKYGI